ncbi:MAG: hypothetical protein RSC66_12470, partial [Comamonas sp.]
GAVINAGANAGRGAESAPAASPAAAEMGTALEPSSPPQAHSCKAAAAMRQQRQGALPGAVWVRNLEISDVVWVMAFLV